jgi:hypothetical protein
MINKANSDSFTSWQLVELSQWIKQNFSKLLRSIPECMEMYMGTDAAGASMRRYSVIHIGDEIIESESESEDEEEQERAAEYWRNQKIEEERQLMIERVHCPITKAQEAEIKRLEAERDPTLHAKVPIISRKEQEAIKEAKNKQGVRLRKTGARRKKYEGPGAAAVK